MLKRLRLHAYVDDVCMLAHSHLDIQLLVNELAKTVHSVGLTININKTKSMHIGTKNTNPINVETHAIQMQTPSNILPKPGKLSVCWINCGNLPRLHLEQKCAPSTVILNQLFRKHATDAWGTWKTIGIIINNLQVFTNKCLRKIACVRWKDRTMNTDTYQKSRNN